MLENYYVRPETVDRIRGSWIVSAIEQYVGWMVEQRYTARSVLHRVPFLVRFGEYAEAHGASEFTNLPEHVEPFVQAWVRERARGRGPARARKAAQEVRNPICQMLRLAIPGYLGPGRPHKPDNPFERQAPRFLAYLVEEKGLRPRSVLQYRFHLRQFAAYLKRIGVDDLTKLSPTVLSGFIAEYSPRVAGQRFAMPAGRCASSSATCIAKVCSPRTSALSSTATTPILLPFRLISGTPSGNSRPEQPIATPASTTQPPAGRHLPTPSESPGRSALRGDRR